jgi:peptidoglycan/LPS O-acetylase OafA/YrhL
LLPFLDGIRGLMAIWVFIYHAQFLTGAPIHIPAGAIAVDVFMFISGLLMAFHYRNRQAAEPWESPTTWGQFYIRRIFRIAPLYYIFLCLTFMSLPSFISWERDIYAVFPLPWEDALARDPSAYGLTLSNVFLHLSFLFGMFPTYASNNTLPDWSLSLEMQFYCLFPFMMLFSRRFGFGALVIICTVIFAGSWKLFGVYITSEPKVFGVFPQPSLLALKINCFLIGILVSEHFHQRRKDHPSLILMVAVALCLYHQALSFAAVVVVTAALLFGTESWRDFGLIDGVNLVRGAFSSRLARHFGDISYGIYLSHMLVGIPIAYFLLRIPTYLAASGTLRLICFLIVAGIPIYMISLMGHILIEKPFISLGKSLTMRKQLDASLAPSLALDEGPMS